MIELTLYTPAEFAALIGKNHSTVWRWLNTPGYDVKLKMYDARVCVRDGVKYIEVTK